MMLLFTAILHGLKMQVTTRIGGQVTVCAAAQLPISANHHHLVDLTESRKRELLTAVVLMKVDTLGHAWHLEGQLRRRRLDVWADQLSGDVNDRPAPVPVLRGLCMQHIDTASEKRRERPRQRQRDRETERQRDRQTQTDTQRHRERQRERDRESET